MRLNNSHTINRPITVVMATFNGAKYVAAQIDSILAQTVKPQEIIVCDDASTDETIQILKAYQAKGKIQLHENLVNMGIVANFKKAVSFAIAGNDIAFADQDDIWLPEKLEILSEAMQAIAMNDQPCLVYSDLEIVDRDLKPINPSFWNELNHQHHQHCFTTLLFGNFVTGCSAMIDASMRNYFLAMPEEKILHDVWVGMIGYGMGNVRAISRPLVLYRQHEKNVNYKEGTAKKTTWGLRILKLKMAFGSPQYLEEEIKIASLFYEKYHAMLSEENRLALQQFMALKNQSFLRKYRALKKTFQQKWGKPTDY